MLASLYKSLNTLLRIFLGFGFGKIGFFPFEYCSDSLVLFMIFFCLIIFWPSFSFVAFIVICSDN